MALIIEDGSIVSGANSYTTDVEFVAYAAARGYTIGASEADRDILQIKAMDYLASLEDRYQGSRTSSTQEVSFPRYNVILNDFTLASDAIPQSLKNAQMELAYQVNSEELLISESIGSSSGSLTGFNVDGVYSETYSPDSSTAGTTVTMGKANAYLRGLLKDTTRLVRA
jgi:hypothetical protein